MSKITIKTLTLLTAAVMMLIALPSCKTVKQNVVLMSDLQAMQSGTLPFNAPEARIQPEDELAILVTAEIPSAADPYNLPINTLSSRYDLTHSPETRRLQTYRVNKQGDIVFPVLGKLHVAGMTLIQLTDMLTKRISENVENPIVTVDLLSFGVKITGDVKTPGLYSIAREHMSILDAIAAAGDINISGRRDNVLIIREENGETKYHRIDLTNSKSWDPEYFYLRQNDVIYVEPGPTKLDELTYNQRRQYNVNMVTIIISSISVVTSLAVAFIMKP